MKNPDLKTNIPEPKIYFESKSNSDQYLIQQKWYTQYPDILFSLIVIGLGLINIIFKKFIMPAKKVKINKFGTISPIRDFYSSPYFGIILVILGLVLLIYNLIYLYLKSI